MQYPRLLEALDQPAHALGVLPDLASLRPQFHIHLYEVLASTNDTAWQLINDGEGSAGTVVIAQQQKAGRGQWGRTWVSAQGGLYLSLVLEPELTIAQSTLLTLASAWGVATSLSNLGMPLQVKWPNDLVHSDRKVGGILAESRISPLSAQGKSANSQIRWSVVGIGLNWDNPLPEGAVSLRQLLPDDSSIGLKSLEDLAAIVLRGLLQGYYYWQQQGDLAFINAYQQRLACLGKKVNVDGHSSLVEGVTATGNLVISKPQVGFEVKQSFKPGEISLGYNV